MFKAESYLGYKLCWPGDLVINSLWAWARGLGVSEDHGIISSAYGVYRIRDGRRVLPRFLHYLVRSEPYRWELHVRSRGVWTSRLQLTDDRFLNSPFPLPPPEEQAVIVRYLDWACGRLDRAIRAKRKIIALLNEHKQAIIRRAVTCGLDPNTSLRPSGVTWLPKVPSHWKVVRNLGLFSNRVESGKENLPILQVSIRAGVTFDETDQFGRPKRLIAEVSKYKVVRHHDLAYNTMRMWQGAIGVSPADGLVSPAYVVLQPRPGTNPFFYNYVFRTALYMDQVNRYSTGIVSDRNRLYWDSFKQMPNIAPPTDEQAAIVDFIGRETSSLDGEIGRAEREIALLREYRIRLIADVVTGKLDVREAAAALPAEEPDSGRDALAVEDEQTDDELTELEA